MVVSDCDFVRISSIGDTRIVVNVRALTAANSGEIDCSMDSGFNAEIDILKCSYNEKKRIVEGIDINNVGFKPRHNEPTPSYFTSFVTASTAPLNRNSGFPLFIEEVTFVVDREREEDDEEEDDEEDIDEEEEDDEDDVEEEVEEEEDAAELGNALI